MFFKKKNTGITDENYSIINADMHSHLLPGIDDGSPDIETSLGLIKGMRELGFKKLITTPHILWDMYKNTTQVICEKLHALKERIEEEKIDIEIEAAGEYFLDDHVESLLKQKEPLLSFGNKMVLVEFSMASFPLDVKDILFEMQLQGYQPVIAHPERYIYLQQNKKFYAELKDAGYLFQLNVLSLGGHYGTAVAELAQHLAKKQYYNLVGTDLHNFRHLELLRNPSLISSLKKLLATNPIINQQL